LHVPDLAHRKTSVNQSATSGAAHEAGGWPAAAAASLQAGGGRPVANATVMLRPLLGISEPDLERQLLRQGVVRLAAGRAHCHDCGRTPLVGEHVHLFDDGDLVCELCRPRRSGAPERSEAVHHSERGHTVRRRAA
jgi:hypothetical protein